MSLLGEGFDFTVGLAGVLAGAFVGIAVAWVLVEFAPLFVSVDIVDDLTREREFGKIKSS